MKSKEGFDPKGFNTMSVALHKTSLTYGPSHLVISPDILPVLTKLVEMEQALQAPMAPIIAVDRGPDMVFQTSQGLSSSSSDINRYLIQVSCNICILQYEFYTQKTISVTASFTLKSNDVKIFYHLNIPLYILVLFSL